MDLTILESKVVLGSIVAFSIACTKLIESNFTENRKFWLPFISVIIGSIAAGILVVVPKELLPLLQVLSSLITGTGGYGAVMDVAKATGKNVEILEPPVVHNGA